MSNKKDQPKFNPTAWMNDHPLFVAWWKEHRHSGHAISRDKGYTRWGITPWQAYDIERYRAEYLGWSPDPVINAKIPEWREEQRKVEAKTAELEASLGKEFWNHLTPAQFIANVKMGVREVMEAKGSMAEKLEKAYAHEPGQSAEETELLKRRRPPE